MKARDVASVIESIAPISSGMKGDELGFVYGGPDQDVTGVAVCWSPTLAVIEQAREMGCNMVVSHEPLLYQKRWSSDAEAKNVWFEEAEDSEKAVNKRRAAALKAGRMCVWRAHSNWDLAPGIGIIDAIVDVLDFGPPIRRGAFTTLHEIEPISVGDLAQDVQRRLRTGAVRVVGDLDRTVTRVATLIGGLGQMFNSPEEVAALGAEAVVAGECLAYTLHLAQELNLAVIEAGHCASENPGMRALARWLGGKMPIRVEFLDTGAPWSWSPAPEERPGPGADSVS